MGITMPSLHQLLVLYGTGMQKRSGKTKADLLQYYKEVYSHDAKKMADYLKNAN
jgi:hypothetical protein